ncbi:MAG: hypothetical protein AAF399_11840 [Bacteroidota bacterium]
MKSLLLIALSGITWNLLIAQNLPFRLDISITQGGIASQLDKEMWQVANAVGLFEEYRYNRRDMWDYHDLSLQVGLLAFRSHPEWRCGVLYQRAATWENRFYDYDSPNSSLHWLVQRDRRVWGVWLDRRLFPVNEKLTHRWEGSIGLGVNAMRSASFQELNGFSQVSGFQFIEIRQERMSALWYGFSFRSSLEYYLAPFLSLQVRMDGFWFPAVQEIPPQPDPPIDWIDEPLKPYLVQLASVNIMFGLHFHLR